MSARATRLKRLRRSGFSLLELLVAMVVTAVLGMALVRTMMFSNRYVNRLEYGREARGTVRAALNLASSELRMVSANTGIETATVTSLTLRVPFRVGLACTSTAGIPGVLVATFMPADTSIAGSSLGYNGFGHLQSTGEYAYVNSSFTPTTGANSSCTLPPASLSLVPGSAVLVTTGVSLATPIAPATPVILWRRVRYAFAPSVVNPGRTAFWRHQLDNNNAIILSEELAAPLHERSRFGFFINNDRVSSDTLPTALADLRGIELRLSGESARIARGTTQAEQSRLRMSIFFLNRPD